MTEIEEKSYKFADLSDSAKEKARENWREGNLEYEWWDSVYDYAKEIGAAIGFRIENIFFSGFSSQSDGSCAEGYYEYHKGWKEEVDKIGPVDSEILEIATKLQQIQRIYFYRLCAGIKHRGFYHHSGCTEIDVEDSERLIDVTYSDYEEVCDLLRKFMDWIYKCLETEYDYLMSDECVDDAIIANEYEFDEDGSIA